MERTGEGCGGVGGRRSDGSGFEGCLPVGPSLPTPTYTTL